MHKRRKPGFNAGLTIVSDVTMCRRQPGPFQSPHCHCERPVRCHCERPVRCHCTPPSVVIAPPSVVIAPPLPLSLRPLPLSLRPPSVVIAPPLPLSLRLPSVVIASEARQSRRRKRHRPVDGTANYDTPPCRIQNLCSIMASQAINRFHRPGSERSRPISTKSLPAFVGDCLRPLYPV